MRLKEIRLERGLSQADLASLSGIDKSHLSRLESGVRTPNYSTLKTLADALEISIDVIFNVPSSIVPITEIRYYNCHSDINGDDMLAIDPGKFPGVKPADMLALNVNGDEMAPTINPGDTAIFNTADTAIGDGIFAFETASGVALGRIVLSKISGTVTVASDNPNHRDQDVADPADLNILGRVIGAQRHF